MNLWLGIFWLILANTIYAKQIAGVFTSLDSITFQNPGGYPDNIPTSPSWIASISWFIDGSTMSAGDTFTLHMPYVYKFTAATSTVNLNVNNVAYATCTYSPGGVLVNYSELECVISDAVSSSSQASGYLSVPFVFQNGWGHAPNDIEAANQFVAGTNSVVWTDGYKQLSTTVNFDAGRSTYSTSDQLPTNQLVYSSKSDPPLQRMRHYVLSGSCGNDGMRSGTFGLTFSANTIDCTQAYVGITNDVNDWFYPKSYQPYTVSGSCQDSSYVVTYNNIPAGYRVFMDLFIKEPANSGTVSYTNTYFCGDSQTETNSDASVNWGPVKVGPVGGAGQVIQLVTKTWTGSVTEVTTLPYTSDVDYTKTIEIDLPIPTITTTLTGSDNEIRTKTFPGTPGGTGTVEVFTPPHLTTVTTPWTGTSTSYSTVTPSNSDGTTTVEVYTPPHLTTVTTPWTGTTTSYSTITPSNSDGTTTVEVYTPPHLTTVTTPWTGTTTSYSTVTPSNSDGTTTVEVYTPPHLTTVTTPWTGTTTSYSTVIPSNSDGTTTVEVYTPPHLTTVTTPWTGTTTSYSTVIPSNSDGTTTVEVYTPPHLTTVTTPWTGTTTSYSTVIPSNSGGTTTVEVFTPFTSSSLSSSLSHSVPGFSFSWSNSSYSHGKTMELSTPSTAVSSLSSVVGISTSVMEPSMITASTTVISGAVGGETPIS
ncbi:hypothetical protein CAAN1_05S05138 [[Candida] anglica]|uniref:Agglutinin-like protein N-terminal domain-containing protein n=1 Tax=[Candida] anglica TaxID=148631 RepID=A0ABP0EHH6_9ASCO